MEFNFYLNLIFNYNITKQICSSQLTPTLFKPGKQKAHLTTVVAPSPPIYPSNFSLGITLSLYSDNLHHVCYLILQLKDDQKAQVSEFFKLCYYVQGPYNEASGFIKLNTELEKLGKGKDVVNRLFYLALPPSVFMDASENIKQHCMGSKYVIGIGIIVCSIYRITCH